jgi:hypothetical protein
VVYFSGLGSLAHVAAEPKLVPSLVPFDALPDSGSGDINMMDLEALAAKFAARQARITYVVDASYVAPPATKDFQGKPWRPVPRCYERGPVQPDDVRDVLYRGQGVMLAACGPLGSAYELQQNVEQTSWQGAFSSMLEEEVYDGARSKLSAQEAMVRVSLLFKPVVSASYLTNQNVSPPIGAPNSDFSLNIFSSSSPDVSKFPDLARILAKREQRQSQFQVAIDLDALPGPAENAVIATVASALKSVNPNTHVVGPGQCPDRVLHLDTDLDTVEVKQGEAASKLGSFSIRKGELVALCGRLATEWECLQLARFASEHSGPMDGQWLVKPDGSGHYGVDDDVALAIKAPCAGFLVAISRDSADGLYETLFPEVCQPTCPIPAGESTFEPNPPLGLHANDTPGTTWLSAILLPQEFQWKMSSVPANLASVSKAEFQQYDAALLKTLREVNAWIRDSTKKWAVHQTSWIFTP